MNNILFGLIGFLMLSITGLGFAEVKGQMDAKTSLVRDDAAQTSQTASQEGQVRTQEQTPSVTRSLASVATKVVDAVDDVSIGRSHDDEDDDEDDWDEDRDEDDDRGSAPRASAPVSTQPVQTPSTSVKTYTMAEVAAHGSAASCWSAINGNVYDLTSFVSQHPGGQAAIKSLCGVDGSSAFNGQHGGQSRPANELASLKIGVLK